MARAEAQIHSYADQLISNVHAIEQAVANHRWVETSRLMAENAKLLFGMMTCLQELDEQSHEYVNMELAKLRLGLVVPDSPAETVVGPIATIPVPAAPVEGAVGVIKRNNFTKKETHGKPSTGSSKNPAGPDQDPHG